jgi:hypothetical protein
MMQITRDWNKHKTTQTSLTPIQFNLTTKRQAQPWPPAVYTCCSAVPNSKLPLLMTETHRMQLDT